MPFTIGIDISTTATKVLLLDAQGHVVTVAAHTYPFDTPHPLWSEQDPALWWDAVQQGIRDVFSSTGIASDAIEAIGLTGQMHGLVLLDDQGDVLRPAILWNDQRTGAECDIIRERLGKKALIQATGNDALTGFTAPKILWVQTHEPDLYARIHQILLPKDYIRFLLTNDFATDKAGAAGTLLVDVQTRQWSPQVCRALEVNMDWLPPMYEGPEVTGTVTHEAAHATGLAPGTRVVAGAGDQAAQAVGVGAIEEGVLAVTLGTSGVVFGTSNAPLVEPDGRLHAFCHALPQRWHLMGVMLSAAGSFRWYRDTLAPHTEFADLATEAAAIAPGSEGLFFLPYLTGERTPYPDPEARGGFIGLTVRHTRAHMTRAVLEGVAFGLRDSFTLMQHVGLPPARQVRISGGGAKSPLWRQIIADILGSELVTVNTTEGAAYGAALLAGVGAGFWPDVETAAAQAIFPTGATTPHPESVSIYNERYPGYQALYPALQHLFGT